MCVVVCVCVCVCVNVCVCVCVCERERENVCSCECVCVCADCIDSRRCRKVNNVTSYAKYGGSLHLLAVENDSF